MPRASDHVFLSYARSDFDVAKMLAAALESKGLSVWWDFRMSVGHQFREEIARNIDAATKVIVIWSPASISSGFVLDEAARALKQNKLIPVSISAANAPLGFGHLHTLPINSVQADIEEIVAALLGRPKGEIATPRKRPRPRLIRILVVAVILLLAASGVTASLVDRHHIDRAINCLKYGCELNYVTYRSEAMRLELVYPMRHLTLDTTKEHLQRIPMLNSKGGIEVEISRSPLPSHRDPIQGSAEEQRRLELAGNKPHYIAPQKDPQTKNWYVVSGMLSDGRIYYIRRWYTSGDVVSIEYRYEPEMKALYDKIIVDMTLRGIKIFDPL